MFCKYCGKQIPDIARFCPSCGNQQFAEGPAFAQPEVKQEKKKSGRVWLIIGIVLLCVSVGRVGLLVVDRYVINTPEKLTQKLEGTVWYTTPAVAVNGDSAATGRMATSIEFHKNGKATVTYYFGEYYGDDADMMPVETESVEWEIDADRNFILDGEEYSMKPAFADEEDDGWYLEEDTLYVDRAYYAEDEWGYDS